MKWKLLGNVPSCGACVFSCTFNHVRNMKAAIASRATGCSGRNSDTSSLMSQP